MKRKYYKIIIAISVAIIVVLSIFLICKEAQIEKVEAKDTDGDGYLDDVDDFPNDPSLSLDILEEG